MQVPALYCGLADDVRKVVRKQIGAYLRGAPWLEAIDGPLTESEEAHGLLYVEQPGMAGAPKTPQVYMYLPYHEAFNAVERGRLPAKCLDELREMAMSSDWGLAVMLGGLCAKAFVRSPDCWPRVLRSALDRWAILDAVGARYAGGTPEGKRLWVVAGGLHYSIARLGVTNYPKGRGIVFDPGSFFAEHGLLERVMSATTHP